MTEQATEARLTKAIADEYRAWLSGDRRSWDIAVEAMPAILDALLGSSDAVTLHRAECQQCGGSGRRVAQRPQMANETDFDCSSCGGSGKTIEATETEPTGSICSSLPHIINNSPLGHKPDHDECVDPRPVWVARESAQ